MKPCVYVQVESRSAEAADAAMVEYVMRNPQVLRAAAGDLPEGLVPRVSLATMLHYVQTSARAPIQPGDAQRLQPLADAYLRFSQVPLRRKHRRRWVTKHGPTNFMPHVLAGDVVNTDCEEEDEGVVVPGA